MIDALGSPQSILVLGGTSDIARATVAKVAGSDRMRRVVLAGRDAIGLDVEATRLRGCGVPDVQVVGFDATDTASHDRILSEIFAAGDVDVVLVAFGVLPDQQRALDDPSQAVAAATVNYLGALSCLLVAARELRAQGHGKLVVLSSVAAERPRRSNFVYGSTKAGLDALARGLGDELAGSGVSVLVVRPGFVRSKMTAGLDQAPLATTPEVVAEAIFANLRGGSRTIWVPRSLRAVMAVLRNMPGPVFRRLPL